MKDFFKGLLAVAIILIIIQLVEYFTFYYPWH